MSAEPLEIADDTETQLEQMAEATDKSESEIRALAWKGIAEADTGSVDGEYLFETVIGNIYQDAVDAATSGESEVTASATSNSVLDGLGESDEPLEAYGTGVEGDTSREEYEQRQKQTDIMADALDELEDRREGEM